MGEQTPLNVSAGFCLQLALLLLLVPFRWLCAILLAAIFHEFCHYAAIRLLTGNRSNVRLFSYAAHMNLPEMSCGAEILCSLVGPIGGILLGMLWLWFPRLAMAGVLQSVYNLLPIYPLDGGRVLRCLLKIAASPPKAEIIEYALAFLCRIGILAVGLYGWIGLEYGPFCLLFSILMVIRIK